MMLTIVASSTAHKSSQGLALGSGATVWAAEQDSYGCQATQNSMEEKQPKPISENSSLSHGCAWVYV